MDAFSDGELLIAGRPIGPSQPAFLIAEIGINHNGCVDRARALVDAAKQAGADCVKFQMRDLSTLFSNGGRPDDCREDLGSQYLLDTLARSHLDQAAMFAIFDHAKASGILPLCTPCDVRSLEALEAYGMPAHKVASADLTNHELLGRLAATGKALIVSTGMSNEEEIRRAVHILREYRTPFALLHCVSAYPPPDSEINLRYITRLRKHTAVVGYSGHERGTAIAIAARALGAAIIEKHFTLDRALPGIDHKISLQPEEFAHMVGAIRQVEAALGGDGPRHISHGEIINRHALGKSLVANARVQAGTPITEEMIAVRSPGNGLPPYRRNELVGQCLRRPLSPGDLFYPSDLCAGRGESRRYAFDRPWGLPVRFHDAGSLIDRFRPDFVEFHLSYRDLDERVELHLQGRRRLGLTVHAPDQFAGEQALDLASDDAAVRAASVRDLQRVIDLARALAARFTVRGPLPIVVSLGGFSPDRFVPKAERAPAYERIARLLNSLDTAGVSIMPQTLPPFPWHFGGRRFASLFVEPDEIAWFCREFGYEVCFDVSHSKLAANFLNLPFAKFVDQVAPLAAQLHLSDAAGVDREGLQIGEGEIDFPALADSLERLAPKIRFVPEPWQGHHDEGMGFELSLDRLELLFGRRSLAERRDGSPPRRAGAVSSFI